MLVLGFPRLQRLMVRGGFSSSESVFDGGCDVKGWLNNCVQSEALQVGKWNQVSLKTQLECLPVSPEAPVTQPFLTFFVTWNINTTAQPCICRHLGPCPSRKTLTHPWLCSGGC